MGWTFLEFARIHDAVHKPTIYPAAESRHTESWMDTLATSLLALLTGGEVVGVALTQAVMELLTFPAG